MYFFHLIQQTGASIVFLSDPQYVFRGQFFLACSIAAVLIPIGGFLGSILLPVSPRQIVKFRCVPLDDSSYIYGRTTLFFLIYSSFCLFLFVSYIQNVGSSPLLGLITGRLNPLDAAFARAESGAGSVGLIYGIGLRFFMPFLFVVAFIGSNYFREFSLRILCLLMMVVAFLYNGWASDKTPVAMLFFLVMISLFLRHRQERLFTPYALKSFRRLSHQFVKRKRGFYIAVVVSGVMLFAYPVFVFSLKPAGEQGLAYIILHVFLRIVWKPALTGYAAFDAFSTTYSFTGFADIKKLADLVGWEYVDLSKLMAVYQGMPTSTNANTPPPAVGNFYAQGGWLVIVFGVLLASFVFKFTENIICRARVKTIVHQALYALLLFGAFRFSWASFHTILASEVIVPIMLVLGIWALVRRSRCGLSSVGASRNFERKLCVKRE
jgi:hypothetical protein